MQSNVIICHFTSHRSQLYGPKFGLVKVQEFSQADLTFGPHSWITWLQVARIFPSLIELCHSILVLFYGSAPPPPSNILLTSVPSARNTQRQVYPESKFIEYLQTENRNIGRNICRNCRASFDILLLSKPYLPIGHRNIWRIIYQNCRAFFDILLLSKPYLPIGHRNIGRIIYHKCRAFFDILLLSKPYLPICNRNIDRNICPKYRSSSDMELLSISYRQIYFFLSVPRFGNYFLQVNMRIVTTNRVATCG